MDSAPIEDRPPPDEVALDGEDVADLEPEANRPMVRQRMKPVGFESVDDAVGRAADPRRLLRDRVEDCLGIAGGARERAQDPDRGSELLADSGLTRGRRISLFEMSAERRSRELRFCICALTTTKWKSRNG